MLPLVLSRIDFKVWKEVINMVSEGRGRLFKRKDGKFLIYLPKDFAEDSQFPFKDFKEGKTTGVPDSIYVKVRFDVGVKKLLVEEWKEPQQKA